MINSILGGIIGGIISPLILSLLQHKWIWKSQRKLEHRYAIFQEAVLALSQYYTDALDPSIQANKPTYQGKVRETEARRETWVLLNKAESMVESFFSKEAFNGYHKAVHTRIVLGQEPHIDFEAARTHAIVLLARELGIQ